MREASPGRVATFHLSEPAERSFAYAQATSDGNCLYVSGTLSVDEAFVPVGEGDMAAQLRQIYGRIGDTLAANGIGFAQVLKETVFVTDIDAMLGANEVRTLAYGAHTPACTVVEVRRLAFPACLAEIEVVATLQR
ncbi:MAG TPA: RidA family protein [Vicinamibacterales bacterium]|nr:RidA family protein [Vicinamibacterales bacterium]